MTKLICLQTIGSLTHPYQQGKSYDFDDAEAAHLCESGAFKLAQEKSKVEKVEKVDKVDKVEDAVKLDKKVEAVKVDKVIADVKV
jgi:hypothetical protein